MTDKFYGINILPLTDIPFKKLPGTHIVFPEQLSLLSIFFKITFSIQDMPEDSKAKCFNILQ
jgi:hypothetical protein